MKQAIKEERYEDAAKIRDEIKKYIPKIQNLAHTLSEIDVLASLSVVSEENNYVRPVLNEENIIDIFVEDKKDILSGLND